MTNDTFKIRDKRKKGWFIIDNDYLNGYAKVFGPIGTGIYLSLCRHADNETQSCWPSQRTIATEIGVNERTIRNHMKKLEEWNLVSVVREIDEYTKRKKVNVYFLMDKLVWKKPVKNVQGNYIPSEEPAESNNENQGNIKTETTGTPVPIKETLIKKTNKKETHMSNCCFEDFWDEYPQRENKKNAETIWGRIDHKMHSLIIEDIKKRKVTHGSWLRGYIPSPTTYLNGERWKDDIISEKQSKMGVHDI